MVCFPSTGRRLFGRGVRVRRGHVRIERVPAAAAVVVRDTGGRGDAGGRRCHDCRETDGRPVRRVGDGDVRVHADGHGVPSVPGVRGARAIRRGQSRTVLWPAVCVRAGAPVQLGRRRRADDCRRHHGPRLGHVPVQPRVRDGRDRRRTGRLRVRLRAPAQRHRTAVRLLVRHRRLLGRRPGDREKGTFPSTVVSRRSRGRRRLSVECAYFVIVNIVKITIEIINININNITNVTNNSLNLSIIQCVID